MKRRKRRASSNRMEYQTLEPKKLLAGAFDFDGQVLHLSPTEPDVRIVVQQFEDAYRFSLNKNTWQGSDSGGVSGAGTNVLEVDRGLLAHNRLFLEDTYDVQGEVLFYGGGDYSDVIVWAWGFDRIGQSNPGPGITFSHGSFDAHYVSFTNPNNHLGTLGIFDGEVRLNSVSSVNVRGTRADNLVIHTEGSLQFENHIIGKSVKAFAEGNVGVFTSEFDLESLTVSGRNLTIRAHTSGHDNHDRPLLASLQRLNFNASATAVISVQDDSSYLAATRLFGDNSAETLLMNLQGTLAMSRGATLDIVNNAILQAKSSIWMGHYEDNLVSIGGGAQFSGLGYMDYDGYIYPGQLSIGELGQIEFGSLALTGATERIKIHEDGNMDFDIVSMTDVKVGELFATGTIKEKSSAEIRFPGRLSLNAEQSIVLGESESDRMVIEALELESGESIYIGGLGSQEFGSITFRAEEHVRIGEDDSMRIAGESYGANIELHSAESVGTKRGTAISTDGTLKVFAANKIELANRIGERLFVGKRASFRSGMDVIVGANGHAELHSLHFKTGYAQIKDQSRTILVGNSTANDLRLTSAHHIWDNPNATLAVNGLANFTTPRGVLFANHQANRLEFANRVVFDVGEFVIVRSDGEVCLSSWSQLGNAFTNIQIDELDC